ncbi:hypothetical protein H6P81_010391 [Aristolochia fimbriata]|uniref:Uncharacterized protein n=1 Tax=Aristolochia fimbriata TaxID=158543 RepID=A0AAV7EPR9_ARIFI|nr:hypothetical protein H6P81_010391 [Aristolochia fimbriata]
MKRHGQSKVSQTPPFKKEEEASSSRPVSRVESHVVSCPPRITFREEDAQLGVKDTQQRFNQEGSRTLRMMRLQLHIVLQVLERWRGKDREAEKRGASNPPKSSWPRLPIREANSNIWMVCRCASSFDRAEFAKGQSSTAQLTIYTLKAAIAKARRSVDDVVSVNHISVVDISKPEYEDALAAFEGDQATVVKLKKVNLGIEEDPRPTFPSATLTKDEET